MNELGERLPVRCATLAGGSPPVASPARPSSIGGGGDDAKERFDVLDGWRGVSILIVLATHLLPLGPKSWQLNATAGPLGMALFFTLSGFLITHFLAHHESVVDFLVRRAFRIVPLAWTAMVVALVASHAAPDTWWANLLFFANVPPVRLTDVGSHLWSLCVEVQFYLGVALLFAALARRGLLLLPIACALVTIYRIATGTHVSSITYLRVDEILAGAVLALVHEGDLGGLARRAIARTNPYLALALLVLACHPRGGFVNYLRPYAAALTVGATLYNGQSTLSRALKGRRLAYVAAVSYALYVDHQLLEFTWLGEGTKLVKYAKRPLLIGASFLIAHLSTFHFENHWIALGKRLSLRLRAVPLRA